MIVQAWIGPFLLIYMLVWGCARQPLTLFSEYVDRRSLASYHVQTPDPKLEFADLGQLLYVSWSLPEQICKSYPHLECRVEVHFCDGSRRCYLLAVEKARQCKTIEVLNKDYFDTGGIISYMAEVVSGSVTLYHWEHQLWNEQIEVGTDSGVEDAIGCSRRVCQEFSL